MSKQPPSPTASNGPGKDARGRFTKGNKLAKGNPLAQKAQQLRTALFDSVTKADMVGMVRKLVELARAGDIQAAKTILDRLLGPPLPLDIEERLDELEQRLQQQQGGQ